MVKFTIRLLIKTCNSLYIKMLNRIFCSEKEREENKYCIVEQHRCIERYRNIEVPVKPLVTSA